MKRCLEALFCILECTRAHTPLSLTSLSPSHAHPHTRTHAHTHTHQRAQKSTWLLSNLSGQTSLVGLWEDVSMVCICHHASKTACVLVYFGQMWMAILHTLNHYSCPCGFATGNVLFVFLTIIKVKINLKPTILCIPICRYSVFLGWTSRLPILMSPQCSVVSTVFQW